MFWRLRLLRRSWFSTRKILRRITEKVSFHVRLLLLMNFYRRGTRMRVVFEDEVFRKVKARYHYQGEDKASFLYWIIFPLFSLQSFGCISLLLSFRSEVLKQILTLAKRANSTFKLQEKNPKQNLKMVWYHGQLLDLNLGTNTRMK